MSEQGHPAAEILREISDEASVNPRWWEAFERWNNTCQYWGTVEYQVLMESVRHEPHKVRRKPKKRCLYDTEGNYYEFPEPVREEPRRGEVVHAVDLSEADFTQAMRWAGSWDQRRLLRNGMIHRNWESCYWHGVAIAQASESEEGGDGENSI